LKQPTFLTIFTEEPWVDYLYDVLLSIDNQNNFSFDQDKVIDIDDLVKKCFDDNYLHIEGAFYQSLNISNVLDWAKEKIETLNDPLHDDEDTRHTEHIRLANCIIALYMLVTSYVRVGDKITVISLELPDVIHVTVQ